MARECKHQMKSGCYYCHARQERPQLNGGVRQPTERRAVVARGALTQAAWRGEARVTPGRMGLRAYIAWTGMGRPVSTQRIRWEGPRK